MKMVEAEKEAALQIHHELKIEAMLKQQEMEHQQQQQQGDSFILNEERGMSLEELLSGLDSLP